MTRRWTNEIMGNEASIVRLLQRLHQRGIKSTKEILKDLQKLVNTDIESFVEVFYKDFIRQDFENYNKFEKLRHLSGKQKKRLNGNFLRRYEYRNTSNLRCIFIVCMENNNDVPILLCAFNEDGDKKTGKKSYNKNIDRAIDIFERVMGGKNGN